jgi:hypothetical protein
MRVVADVITIVWQIEEEILFKPALEVITQIAEVRENTMW